MRLFATVAKITVASLVAGMALSALDISPGDMLGVAGVSPKSIAGAAETAMDWALPNIMLGLFVTVPVWMLIYVFRPPRG